MSLRFWIGFGVAWLLFFLCLRTFWYIGADLHIYQIAFVMMSTIRAGGAVVMSLLEIWEHVNGVHDHR